MVTYHVGFEGRVISSLQQFPPVDLVEERMSLDFGWSFGTKPVIRPSIEQLDQEVLGRQRHNLRAREMERFGKDFTIHLIRVLVVVRR